MAVLEGGVFGLRADCGFEMEEAVLTGWREVVDEAGFCEVVEGRGFGDGGSGLEMECECGEASEATDDGGGAIDGYLDEGVCVCDVEPYGGGALRDAVGIGALIVGEGRKLWGDVCEEGELFSRVAEVLEEADEVEVFGVHAVRWRVHRLREGEGCGCMGDAVLEAAYFKMSRKIAILGPGLLGGSLAMEAGVAGFGRVALWARRREALEEASGLLGGVEVSMDVREVVEGAEVVVVCVPVERMREVLTPALGGLMEGAVVTDVGSVKGRVVNDLGGIVREAGAVFVGGHPMAGSDQAGIGAARRGLFRGAVCVVTPEEVDGGRGVLVVERLWGALGMRVVRMGAAAHDCAVALVSHLPHVVASGLVATIAGVERGAFSVSGPGLRDTTRVASGSPGMWAEILSSNAAQVVPALEAFRERVDDLIGLVTAAGAGDSAGLAKFLEDAKVVRDGVRFP